MHRRPDPGTHQSTPRTTTKLAAGLASVLVALWPDPVAAGPPYRGRSLSEVLNEVGSSAMRLVYSSEIVPSRLRVLVEPTATAGPALLEQLLAPHGLTATHVGGSVYAVARIERVPVQSGASARPIVSGPVEEVVVASSRYRLADDALLERTFLTQAEVEALPRLADDSLKAVHRLPGAATNGLSGLAYMRGGEQSETLVVFDGLPMYEPFHLRLLSSPTSVLDPRTLDSLEVYAGGFTAEFGDRISAVIDARSANPEGERHYEAGLSVFHANALASARFAGDRGQWLAAVRRSNLDIVSEMAKSEIGKPSYADGFGRLDFEFSDATRASLHVLLATDRSSLQNSEDTEFADADYRNSYAWATLDHRWSPSLRSNLLLSYSDVSANRIGTVDEPGRRTGFVDDDRAYHVFGAKLDGSYTTSRWLHRAGVEFRSLSARYNYASRITFEPDYPFPGDPGSTIERALAPSPSGDHTAVYATSRVRLTDRLTTELGLRWDEQTYVRRLGRAIRATSQSGVRRYGYDATARELGRIPAGTEHQRAAGRGRRRGVPAHAARGRHRPRARTGAAGRECAARRGVSQGIPRAARALREPARSAVSVARAALGPRADRAGLGDRERRRGPPVAQVGLGLERLAQLRLVEGRGSRGRRRHAPRVGSTARVRRRSVLDLGPLGGDAGGDLPHGLADHLCAAGRARGRRVARSADRARATTHACRTFSRSTPASAAASSSAAGSSTRISRSPI